MKERDGYQLLVPADWEIPGAGLCPTTPNEDCSEGLLVGQAARVSDLVTAGLDLPGQVFRSHGRSEGERSGVVIGAYAPGLVGSLDDLSQAISKAAPAAAEVQSVVVAEADAVRVNWPVSQRQPGTPAPVFDLWVPVPKPDHQFVVARFWRDGSGSGSEATEKLEYMASSFSLIAPTFFAGINRRVALSYYEAPAAGEAKEGWRLGGVRLGTIFHTKLVPESRLGAYTQAGSRKRDRAVLLAEFVVWLVLIIGLVGWKTPLVLAGAGCYLGATAAAKSSWKAWAGLAVVLVALLAIGLASD
jgi:hypothetical protein